VGQRGRNGRPTKRQRSGGAGWQKMAENVMNTREITGMPICDKFNCYRLLRQKIGGRSVVLHDMLSDMVSIAQPSAGSTTPPRHAVTKGFLCVIGD